MDSTQTAETAQPSTKGRTIAVWTASVLALLASVAVVVVAYVLVLGTAACADASCGGTGPSTTAYGLIQYGVPAVGVAAVVISFVTAKRRYGYLVPLVAWLVIAASLVVLFATF